MNHSPTLKDLQCLFEPANVRSEACRIQNLNPTQAEPTTRVLPQPTLIAPVESAPRLEDARVPLIDGYRNLHSENYRHRLVIELAAKGNTYEEIAGMTGYSVVAIRNIIKVPKLQQTLVDAIRRTADEIDAEVLEIVKEGCLVGAKKMLNILHDDKAGPANHISAAKEFLDRRYGKANQPVNRGTDVDLNTLSIAEVAAKLPVQN